MTGFYSNNATASSNTTLNSIGINGSDTPQNADDALRELAAQGRQFANDLGGNNTVGGTANAITLTSSSGSIAAYYDGLLISFVASFDNTTTTPTFNLDTLGAKPIKKSALGVETALEVGDIRAGGFYSVRYRSSWNSSAGAWQLLGYNINSAATQGTNQSTVSQSSVSFTNIPSGVKEIIVILQRVAVSSDSDDILIRLGTSSGYVSTGYDSLTEFVSAGHSASSSTSGFIIACNVGAAGQIYRATGVMSIVNRAANGWMASFTGQIGAVNSSTSSFMVVSSGAISLGGTLDRVRLLPRFGSAFGSTSGDVNIIYR